jgi:hypothetical protein
LCLADRYEGSVEGEFVAVRSPGCRVASARAGGVRCPRITISGRAKPRGMALAQGEEEGWPH